MLTAQALLRPRNTSNALPEQPTTATPNAPIEQLQPEPNFLPDQTAHFEHIAQLAYSYWQARGCPFASPEEDWFAAEQQLQLTRLSTEVARS